MNYSPMMAGFIAILAVYATSLLRKGSRISFATLIKTLEQGAHNAIVVAVACSAAGIIVGIVNLTGTGLRFSSLVVSLSQGIPLLALLLVALTSLFLGMGLPVTASYIVLIILAGPGLMDLGIPLLTAHMVVFWYSQDANVTPPVSLASFAGAGVARAPLLGVAKPGRNKQLPLRPFLHQQQRLAPARHGLRKTHARRAVTAVGAVDFLAVEGSTAIVQANRIDRPRSAALARLEHPVLQPTGQADHTLLLGVDFEKRLAARARISSRSIGDGGRARRVQCRQQHPVKGKGGYRPFHIRFSQTRQQQRRSAMAPPACLLTRPVVLFTPIFSNPSGELPR